MREILTKEDNERIRDAVSEVEKTTSGEIVPAVVTKSDMYAGALWRVAFSVSLILTYALYYFSDDLFSLIPALEKFFNAGEIPFSCYIVAEILFLLPGFIFGRIPFIFRLAITGRELEEEVYQRALELFHSQGLANTRDRTGILIFVSKLERRVIVLADAGINEKVPEKFWKEIVNEMIPKIKKGDIARAVIDAIKECGPYLSKNFPIKPDDTNELPDDVVT